MGPGPGRGHAGSTGRRGSAATRHEAQAAGLEAAGLEASGLEASQVRGRAPRTARAQSCLPRLCWYMRLSASARSAATESCRSVSKVQTPTL